MAVAGVASRHRDGAGTGQALGAKGMTSLSRKEGSIGSTVLVQEKAQYLQTPELASLPQGSSGCVQSKPQCEAVCSSSGGFKASGDLAVYVLFPVKFPLTSQVIWLLKVAQDPFQLPLKLRMPFPAEQELHAWLC